VLWFRQSGQGCLIGAAEKISDLKAPPSNRLEKLKGDLESFWPIRINKQ
jgi:toxin HigB-1